MHNLNNLGVALFKKGQIEEAAQRFFEAHLKREAHYNYRPLVNYTMCQAYLLIEATEAIHVLIDEAIISPDSEVTNEDIANIYYVLGNYQEYIRLYSGTKLYLKPSWVIPLIYAQIL